MPCRYASGDRSDRGIDDDHFERTALAVGGRRALASLLDRKGEPSLSPVDPVAPERGRNQHDWTAGDAGAGGCPVDHGGADGEGGSAHGHPGARTDRSRGHRDAGEDRGSDGECPVDHGGEGASDRAHGDGGGRGEGVEDGTSPRYHLLLSLDYEGDGPDAADRQAVGVALSDLESAFGWGPDGLAFTLGYSRRYFERFEASLPADLATALRGDDPVVAADGGGAERVGDALLHLASDDARTLLAAELALWGEDPVVDRSLDATFEGVFARPSDPPYRRVAATGVGAMPDGDPELDGAFAGGTLQRVVSRPRADADGGADTHTAADPGGCPAHGGDAPADDVDADRDGGLELTGVAPSDPVVLDVSFDGPDAPVPEGHCETFLVPPVSGRAFPRPDGPTGG